MIMALLIEFLGRLADGCHKGCDYDEAEGGLHNNCEKCRGWLVTTAYQLFISGEGGADMALPNYLRRWSDMAPVTNPLADLMRSYLISHGRDAGVLLLKDFAAENLSHVQRLGKSKEFEAELRRRMAVPLPPLPETFLGG